MQMRNRPPFVSARGKAVGIGNSQHGQYTTATSASAIVSSLALKPCSNGHWQGECPACGYADAFGLSVKDGKSLWHCHACGDSEAVLQSLKALGLLGGRREAFPSVRRSLPIQTGQHTGPGKLAYLRTFWRDSLPLEGTVAARYLVGRGLHGPYPEALRFLPVCKHTPTAQTYPAMIAAVTRWPSEELQAIHRTYLKPDGSGKIDHPQARMMLGDAMGGAVQLAPAGERLAIAEGIETALSVQQEMGFRVWACLSTSGLQNVILPDCVREVVICADNDRNGAGQRAADTAADRLHHMGKRVRIALPPQAGTDFNDILKGHGHE